MSFNLEVNHIAADAVTALAIADDAVVAAGIAAGAVGTSEIATDGVGAAEIAAGAVGTAEIADDAVTAAKIDDNAITAAAIASGAVGASALAGGAAASNIADGTISGALTITGNLTVDGTTTTIDSTTLAIGDHNIVLDRENDGSAVVDGAGFTIEGGSGDDVTLMWSAGSTRLELKKGSSLANFACGTITGTVANTATADALSTARAIALTGPVTGTVNFDGSAAVSIATTIAEPELAALAGLTSAADKVPYFTGSGSANVATFTSFGRSLVDDDNANAARTTLGLASLAIASTVNNDQWAGTDLAIVNGGTGASSAAAAATAFGLGTGDSPQLTAVNVGHASDTTLARASAGDLSVEGNIIYRAGGVDVAVADGGTGASTPAAARAALDLEIGSDVQAYHVKLAAVSNMSATNGRAIIGDGTTFVIESDLYPTLLVQSYISLADAISGTITHSNYPKSVHVATSAGSAATYTLPAVTAANAGYKFEIAGNFGSKTLTLDGNSSQTINGAATYALTKAYTAISIEAFYASSTGFWLIK